MIDDLALLRALRTQLLTVEVATTGATTLAATGTGYTRTTGSFIADGFVVGMEVVPSGFTSNVPVLITRVYALTLETDENQVESAGAGRSLTVGIPVLRNWENTDLERQARRWFISEDYLPGVQNKYGVGERGIVEQEPAYVIRLEGVSRTGADAIYTVARKIMEAFPPTLAIIPETGDIVRVGTDPGPFRGQVLSRYAGTVEVSITIPLYAETSNPI